MNKLKDLTHITQTTPGGAKILVLNTGSVIGPEAEAMLQALHSRSIGGVESHLKVLAEKGADNFMSTYYVGYGHKSIGDLASASIFIEGISMLAAKAIQDWPLYCGQEASTRYIDFAAQPIIDPLETSASKKILENWRTFYVEHLNTLPAFLEEQFPRKDEEDRSIYNKTIKARAFDILRGFLPAGATTNLAWHSNLRQFADKLPHLRCHPLKEVRDIAEATEKALQKAFPNSFDLKRYSESETYFQLLAESLTYFQDPEPVEFEHSHQKINRSKLENYREILNRRPIKTELPGSIAECGQVDFRFLLDFGSFRDLQRHRAVTQKMPLLTAELGFTDWYLNSLDQKTKERAENLIEDQTRAISKLPTEPEVKQYYTAMGFSTTNHLSGNLSALVYLIELRNTRFVHPTLRHRVRQMAEILLKEFSEFGLTIHLDPHPDRFDTKRGEQDIIKK